jgi:hypothetical protein
MEDCRNEYGIYRVEEIITISKTVPSNCFEITFVNEGNTNVRISPGKTLIPSEAVTFTQNIIMANDKTAYSIIFDDNFNIANNRCNIIRGYIRNL